MSSLTYSADGVRQKRKRRKRIPIAEVLLIAETLHKGGLCPKDCSKPAQLAVRIIAGDEVGLSPVQSVNNVMVVRGRASIWGDAALALVRASGLLESISEEVFGEGDNRVGVVIVKRKGEPTEREFRFSVEDAKLAELWEKEGPWTTYPQRMLIMRPRAFALRDVFTDVLCGLGIVEEEQDVPTVVVVKAEASEPSAGAIAGEPSVVSVAAEDSPKIMEETLVQIAEARPAWLRAVGVDPGNAEAVAKAWKAKLIEPEFDAASAGELSEAKGQALLAVLRSVGHRQVSEEILGEPATETETE